MFQINMKKFKIMVVKDLATGYTDDAFMVCSGCGCIFMCRDDYEEEDKKAHADIVHNKWK